MAKTNTPSNGHHEARRAPNSMRVVVARLQALTLGCLLSLGALAQAAPPSAAVQELVILRVQDGTASQLNISHKGQLQAALNAGEFTVMPVCQGEAGFDAVAWAPGVQSGRSQSIQAGAGFDSARQVMVVEVSPSGRIWAAPQPRDSVNWKAQAEHTRVASRVVPQCQVAPVVAAAPVPAVPVATPVAPVVRSMELASYLLFPFASSTINSRQADAMLRERLRAVLPEGDVSRITRIRVIGHSDPVGQPHRKSLVSMQRAQEVANYLQSMLGVSPALFSVETQSDRQLLVANCPQTPVVQRNACNAPNRRVEVLIALQP